MTGNPVGDIGLALPTVCLGVHGPYTKTVEGKKAGAEVPAQAGSESWVLWAAALSG